MSEQRPKIPLPPLLELVAELGIDELHEGFDAAGFEGMRKAHGAVWRFIDVENGSRLTDLAERSGLTRQSLGEVVDDLERLGYVERLPDPSDGRAKLIRMTARGRAMWETGVVLLGEIERRWAERYGNRKLAALRSTLEEILAGSGRPGR